MTVDARNQIETLLSVSPYHRFLDLKLVALDNDGGELRLLMPYQERLLGDMISRRYHGGAIAGLIDATGALAMMAKVGRDTPSITISIDYLRPAVATDLFAKAKIQKCGKKIGIVAVEVIDIDNRIVAIGRVILSLS